MHEAIKNKIPAINQSHYKVTYERDQPLLICLITVIISAKKLLTLLLQEFTNIYGHDRKKLIKHLILTTIVNFTRNLNINDLRDLRHIHC